MSELPDNPEKPPFRCDVCGGEYCDPYKCRVSGGITNYGVRALRLKIQEQAEKIRGLETEVKRLKEFEWMYKELEK